MIEEIDNMLKESRLAVGLTDEIERTHVEILEDMRRDVLQSMIFGFNIPAHTHPVVFKWAEDTKINVIDGDKYPENGK